MSRLLIPILVFCCLSAFDLHAAINLASGGRTEYVIVAPAGMNIIEKEAVNDLRYHLTLITGAKFRIGKPGAKNIFIGQTAPSDKKPLARYERRVKSENGNIYLYGYGRHGNSNAIYDFLEQFLGCQWYSMFGDCKIPRRSEVSFEKLDYSIIPDYLYVSYYGNHLTNNTVRGRAFRRRARIYDWRDPKGGSVVPLLGVDYGHMASRVVPPGMDHVAAHNYYKSKPIKYFIDKKYFKTNPEFFSYHGPRRKRVSNYQHCYSNRELRRTFIENFQLIIDKEYKGGEAHIYADLNDNGHDGMPCCWCAECKKINDRYQHPAGSYWDFLIEFGKHFKAKYPQIYFRIAIYSITLRKPVFPEKLPDNLILRVAPLGTTDFAKSFRDGGTAINVFKEWKGVPPRDFMVQFYPTTYPRPLWGRPLTANIHRLIQNMRDLKAYGINSIDMEIGIGPQTPAWFNDMRLYLIARLSHDVNLDEKELIRDFMENYYGKAAAPIMLKYYYELEKCEAEESKFMRWWEDFRSALSYLTPENILRWQGYFDEMLKVTDRKSRHALNIRRTRKNLDEATVAIWYKYAPGQMPDRDMIKQRHIDTLRASINDSLRTHRNKDRRKDIFRKQYAWKYRSFHYHYALAGKWKPLPEPFASMPEKDILRTVPFINRQPLTDAPDAACGLAVKGVLPKKLHFFRTVFETKDRVCRGINADFKTQLSVAEIKKSPRDKYRFYYIGTTRLFPDFLIFSNGICRGSGVTAGYLYDAKNPDQRYDVYFSLKLDKDNKTLWFDQALFVKSSKAETLLNK